ncbi:murein transglycosylase A [Consotaella salsifontis]|uniref:peptidoglycan lytic exotransglycosylase n=1 Tax=Consotaella salsifontis TaxID=1365950 RepID=A0A1T4T4K5_9HYPH|nr:MltA domain-containing protein [Consotaella salsifontis]SKA35434.1 membrane-bound lytic murein transglycosylase A [Consotaella salsifontis]
MLSPLVRRARFSDLAEWPAAPLSPALAAFRRSAERFVSGEVRTGDLGLTAEAFVAAAHAALAMPSEPSEPAARDFFERHFQPLSLEGEKGGAGFLTGYYEPVVAASLVRTARFRYPLYRRPDDLVPVDDVTRPPGLGADFRFARRREDGILGEYFDRAAIEAGALSGRGLEIAWLENPVDVFFIHVQGSARLALPDGRIARVGYAAKTGHPFTAIGRLLVEEGELTLAEADMAGIRRWLAVHPERASGLMNRNRSYIFFRLADLSDGKDDDTGPLGAANVPLTRYASIAVDRSLHTFGVPIFVDAESLVVDDRPFRRLAVAQDTGSAILGAARADLFCGSGEAAGALAGGIRHPARLFALVPDALWREARP